MNTHKKTIEGLINQEIKTSSLSSLVTMLISKSYDDKDFSDFQYENIQNLTDDVDVFSWLEVTTFLSAKLLCVNAVILETSYGIFWGRTETGQSLSLDSDLTAVAENMVNNIGF